jgi:hypothetical protein
MPNRKSKKAERKKAAEELEDMPGVDLDFKEQQDLQDKLYVIEMWKFGVVC